MLHELYHEVSERLDCVDFPAIWPGFARGAFALYDDKQVVADSGVFPVDDRFLGNTSIELNGVRTAIWNVSDGIDPDALAGGIVHEMFHSFQYTSGEVRFPDDMELLHLGIDDAELSLRALECAILAEESPSLAKWVDARVRRRRANPDLTRQAELSETAEGMAEYAGLTALSRIAPAKYREAIAAHRARLAHPGDALADARRMAYFTGALLLTAAREAGIPCAHALGGEGRPLAEFLLSQIPPEPAGEAPDVRAFAEGIRRVRAEECRAFQESAVHVARSARITGYDPMNMLRSGDYLLCKQFIMLDSELIRGPILLEMHPGSAWEIEGYFVNNASGTV